MNIPRGSLELVSCGEYIYAIGGYYIDDDLTYYIILRIVEKYDPRSDKWTEVSPKHDEHRFSISVVKNEKIFTLSNNTFEVYFPTQNVWKKLPGPDYNVREIFLAHFDGKFYAISGNDLLTRTYVTDTKVFQPTTRSWETFQHLPRELEYIDGLTVFKDAY